MPIEVLERRRIGTRRGNRVTLEAQAQARSTASVPLPSLRRETGGRPAPSRRTRFGGPGSGAGAFHTPDTFRT